MALVRERMTPSPITVRDDATLNEVVALFSRSSISALPVMRDDRLVGLVSTADVVRCLLQAGGEPRTAASLMSAPALVTRPDAPLEEAAGRLFNSRIHRLVVTDGEHLVGILSARDLLEEVLSRRVTAPIRTIMTAPVESVLIDDSIDSATRRLASTNVHGLVVVDGMAPVGVFTHAEAIAARTLPPDLRTQPVESVMSYETICLDLDTPIYRAAAYGMAMSVRRFLVVEHRRLIGIVSCIDLAGVLARAPAA